jgi:acyl-[acyl carrier protein]--UDP-N-acetylglucosamine O-acyltransferase
MHRLRRANAELFSETGSFKERFEAITVKYADDPVVGKVIAFIQQTGLRSLLQPARGNSPEADQGAA